MRRLLPLVAAALLVVAAAGLSSLRPNDHCMVVTTGDETTAVYPDGDYVLWPPGPRCVYHMRDGHTKTVLFGNAGAFLLVLAGGVIAVVRRTRSAWASLIVLAVAGAGVFYAPEINMLLAGFMYGLPLALLVTRSWVVTAMAGAVLFLGAIAYLWDGSTLGWALLLALVAVSDPLEERLVRLVAGPRAELE